MSKWRVGIVGCGGIVERRHLPGFLERRDVVELVAMADVSAERVNYLGDRAAIGPDHLYTDYHELLERETLDVLLMATPHAYHEGPVIKAAGRVPVILVEKPLAPDLSSAERMITACDRGGTRLGVVHNQPLRPAVEVAATLLQTGELGRPYLFRQELLGSGFRTGSGLDQQWRSMRGHGGGCLIDSGYHSICVAERLLGAPVTSVQAQMATLTRDIEVEDTALLVMRHANSALSSIQCGWGIVSGRNVAGSVDEVHAMEGSLLFGHQGAPLAVFRPGREGWETPEVPKERPDDAGYYAFRDRFLAALAEGGPLPASGEDGYHVLQVINAAYRSSESGASVEVAS